MSEGSSSSSIISCRWFLSPTCLVFVVMQSLYISTSCEMLAGRYATAPLKERDYSVTYGFINMQRNPIDTAHLLPLCKNRFRSALKFTRSYKICSQNIHPIPLSISNIWETCNRARLLPNSTLLMIHESGFISAGIGIFFYVNWGPPLLLFNGYTNKTTSAWSWWLTSIYYRD
jgi:hypothetical protein